MCDLWKVSQPILFFGLIWSRTGGLIARCLIPESQLIVFRYTVQRFWNTQEVRWWEVRWSPILKPDGTIPVAMGRVMACPKVFTIMIAAFLRKPGRKLSALAAFLQLSFFSLTNTSETVTGISLKSSLIFVLVFYVVDQMKFLNLIDFSFKVPAAFVKN